MQTETTQNKFEEVHVCPYCGALAEEKFSGDEGWTFCTEGCGCIEGEKTVYKFECQSCLSLCETENCDCI